MTAPGFAATTSGQGRVLRLAIAARGGLPKPSVARIELLADSIAGNAVAHPNVHGGPDRALCLYSAEIIRALQAEGHPIEPGSTGENLTLEGLDWSRIIPGARLHIGETARIEITSYAAPCVQIGASFLDRDSARISQKVHPGWSRVYARILTPGEIRIGDSIEIESR